MSRQAARRRPVIASIMRPTIPVLLAALLALAAGLPAGEADGRTKAREELRAIERQAAVLSRAFELVHEVVAPSVVSVRTRETVYNPWSPRAGAREVEVGEGSGFVIRSDTERSWILTNEHVVMERDRAGRSTPYDKLRVVLWDNREVDAEYVGYDQKTDLAVISIPVGGLPAVEWGDSDQVHVGQWVLALGYPLGIGYSASQGIVSATDRSTGIYASVGGFESFIQTDAAINPGNSGGPLVDIGGRIIGVNANIVSRTGSNIGLGFAIPSNLARRVAEDLLEFRQVRRAAVGVQLASLAPADAERAGLPKAPAVRIDQVIPLTPAAEAGVEPGDVLLTINGQRVQSLHHFRARVAAAPVDAEIVLGLWRGGKAVERRIKPITTEELQRRLDEAAARTRRLELAQFGLTLGEDDRSARLGLVVLAVAPGVDFLRVGDRVLRERALGDLRTLGDAEPLQRAREASLQVVQDGRTFWLTLRR